MKTIDVDMWEHKGYLIMKFEHPKLAGKYEIFKNNETEDRLGTRFSTLKECRDTINNLITNP